jgi:hypothetical protein
MSARFSKNGDILLPHFQVHMENNQTTSAYEPNLWLVTRNGSADYSVHLEDGSLIATVGDGPHDGWPEAVEVNARLIGAAPDLRVASQKLYNAIMGYLMDVPDSELPEDLVAAFDAMEDAWHKSGWMTERGEVQLETERG